MTDRTQTTRAETPLHYFWRIGQPWLWLWSGFYAAVSAMFILDAAWRWNADESVKSLEVATIFLVCSCPAGAVLYLGMRKVSASDD